ncbi:transcriptional regulator, TetR family [Paenibacillus sp. JCM 10914]|nr:hypothetical protein [Paenibacillus sp. JCM 10914]GAE09741.1 transcriptional regulator, TetR family [Paenibacillus sp. JCM 10914]
MITALNEQAGQQFQTLVQQELEKGSSYTLAYIQATRTQMNEADVLSTDASMLAAIANNREALAMWADEYNQFRIKATEEGVPQELASVIRLVCDGIMFAHLFDLDPPGEEELTRVVQYLEALLKKEKDEVES